MSTWKEVHLPCPKCASSDAYCIDHNDVGYCFSCKETVYPEGGVKKDLENSAYTYLGHRGISPKTFQLFKVLTKTEDDIPVEVGFVYPDVNGRLSGDNDETKVKIRSLNEKKFSTKNFKGAKGLFGQNIFDPGSKDTITIVEGEFDALAAYEMLSGSGIRSAVVSVSSASSAKSDCTNNRDYINSFKKIILCFDNDDPGSNAAKEVASLFDFNKLFRVQMQTYKDPNEYLQKGDVSGFASIWKNARKYVPDAIINSFSEIEQSLSKSKEDLIGTYPFKDLQNALYGLHRGEVVVVKGGSGLGKTEFFRAMEHHLLKTTKSGIGIIHLEEDNADTVKGIATYELQTPVFIPELGVSNKDVMDAYKSAVGEDEGRVYIHESFDVEDPDTIIDNIRFLVSSCGCDFIFLDHISWLGAGQENQHLKLEGISQRFKLLAKELRFALIMISHTNDDGKVSGSRNIFKVANTVIHLERDRTAIDPLTRNSTQIVVEKGRRQGSTTGPVGSVFLDKKTGCLRDFKDEDYDPDL